MTNAPKTEKPKANPVEDMDDIVEVERYDVLLPCRTFEISYKLVVLWRVALWASITDYFK